MKPRIVNIKTLRDKKYEELDLGDYYNRLFGKMESKSSIFIYGTSGSGKSVFTLQLANHFANNVGKVLYCSHEEALKKSIRDRSLNFNLDSSKLFIGEYVDFEYLKQKIAANYYRMIIIDSVQYAEFTYDELKELNATFRKRKIIPVLVSFGTGYKKPTCNNDLLHACDIKLFFDSGVLTVDSRYLSTTNKTRLFTPQTGTVQGQLFN